MRRYRGRLAPSPTGKMHMGHGRTFWVGWKRCREVGGELVLRIEDLDKARCREEYSEAAVEDLEWLGMGWDAGPVYQGGRTDVYRVYLKKLEEGGYAYPCYCSRRDILASVSAPHETGDEPLYPGTCRDGVDEERIPAGGFGYPMGRAFPLPMGISVERRMWLGTTLETLCCGARMASHHTSWQLWWMTIWAE